MKRFICACLLLLLPALLCAKEPQSNSKPIALLFPVIAASELDKTLCAEATQAIKTYLRQTGKADVVDFDIESPLVKRALIEHHIKAEDVAAAITPDTRLQMGKQLGTDLVVSGDVMIKDDKVNMSVWIARTNSRKIWRNSYAVPIASAGKREFAISNALQTATSTIIYQLTEELLKDVKPTPSDTTDNKLNTVKLIDPEPNTVSSSGESTEIVAKAQEFVKSGDIANAIIEYRKAINIDPKNISIRLKLIQLYRQRKMYNQALDEIERVKAIDPADEAIRTELALIYEEKGLTAEAAQVYVDYAKENPNDLNARMKSGDYYWQHKMYEEAEEQYRIAAEIDPTSLIPHERLVFILAAQSLFNEARKELDQIRKIDPKPSDKTLSERYNKLIVFPERELNAFLSQYEDNIKSFEDRKITRETLYNTVRGIGLRIASISSFLQGLTPPENKNSTHRHRILSCSLMSQACNAAMSYLETNKASDKEDAAIFVTEAKKHLAVK